MKAFRVALLILTVLFTLGLWQCFRYFGGYTLPSDAQMKEQFRRSRKDLEQLREMVFQDGLNSRIAADYVDDEMLPAERIRQYRRLMSRSGIIRLWAQGSNGPIEFLVDATGFLDVGTYKGFSYNPKRDGRGPGSDAKSLDVSCIYVGEDRHCSAFQHLDENWWMLRYEYR